MRVLGSLDSISRDNPVFGLLGAAAVLVGYLLFAVVVSPLRGRKRPAPLPPGPPGETLLGHYRVVPADAAFKKYADWGKEYGRLPEERGCPLGLPVTSNEF